MFVEADHGGRRLQNELHTRMHGVLIALPQLIRLLVIIACSTCVCTEDNLAFRQRLDKMLDEHPRALDSDDPHHHNEPCAALSNDKTRAN